MKPRMIMLPHPDQAEPTVVGIRTDCAHGSLVFTYEAAAGHTFEEAEQRGLALGKAHAMALDVLRCPCWRDGARTSVGMPDQWQAEGLGSQQRRWLDA